MTYLANRRCSALCRRSFSATNLLASAAAAAARMSDHLSIGFACHSRITVAVTIKTHFSLEQNFFGCHANRNFSVKRWKDSTADFLAQYVKRTVSYFWGGGTVLTKIISSGSKSPQNPLFLPTDAPSQINYLEKPFNGNN